MKGRGLAILVTMLSALALPSKSNATLIHDIGISQTYTNTVNGIRITSPLGEKLDANNSLDKTLGTYTIGFKVENLGDFTESIIPYGIIKDQNQNPVYNWAHSETTFSPDQYKYRSKSVDFSNLENGTYAITVGADLEGDVNLLNNISTRTINVIPEPSTLALLGIGTTLLTRRKRK